jgi:hypothetical protein
LGLARLLALHSLRSAQALHNAQKDAAPDLGSW